MIKINGRIIKITKFPNGESLIKTCDLPNNPHEIVLKFESNEDLIDLMFIKNYFDEKGINCTLELTYVPYSRMDRTEGDSVVFTLKYIAKFINDLNFKRVFINEPHSNVSTALFDRCTILNTVDDIFIRKVWDMLDFNPEKDVIFLPDLGAYNKYSKKFNHENIDLAYGIKNRDFETGKIKSLDIVGNNIEGKRVIIIDDLCSRGGTFLLSGNKLKNMGAEEVVLLVYHCENTIFDGEILTTDIIDKVYTTNSILTDINKKYWSINVIGVF